MIYHHHGGEDFQEHAVQAWQRKMQSDVQSESGATRSQCLHILQTASCIRKRKKRESTTDANLRVSSIARRCQSYGYPLTAP
jgi:hypothetical protein